MIPQFHYNVDDIPWQYLDGQENQEGVLRWKTFLGGNSSETNQIIFGVCEVPPRVKLNPHHPAEEEAYFVQQGDGAVLVDDKSTQVCPGSILYLPGDLVHGIKNVGDQTLILLWIFPTRVWGDVKYIMDP